MKKALNAASRSRAATVPIVSLISFLCIVVWVQRRSSATSAILAGKPTALTALQRHVDFVRKVSDAVLGEELRSAAAERKLERLGEFGYTRVVEAPLWCFRTATYLWDWYTPYWPCADRERIGRAGDGGKWVCGMRELREIEPCIVYSYGINSDVSFETELLDRTKCEIFGFDPTVKALPKGAAKYRQRFHFEKLGLSNATFDQYETLATTMHRLGHKTLTLLKVDVERAETSALPQIFSELRSKGVGVPFAQLLLEVHHSDSRKPDVVNLMEDIESMDVVPFMNEINLVPCINGEMPKVIEYSFLSLRQDELPDDAE